MTLPNNLESKSFTEVKQTTKIHEQAQYAMLDFLTLLTPTNCLGVFDYFVGLALKGLRYLIT